MSYYPNATAAATIPTLTAWDNMPLGMSNSWASRDLMSSAQSLGVFPLMPGNQPFPGNMTANTVMFNISGSGTNAASASYLSMSLGIYTLNGSTLSLLNSVGINYTAGASGSTAFNGPRWLTIHSSQWSSQPVFTRTNYWVGLGFSANTGQGIGVSLLGQNLPANVARWGTWNVNAGAASANLLDGPFQGVFTGAGLPASIGSTGLASSALQPFVPKIVFNNFNASF